MNFLEKFRVMPNKNLNYPSRWSGGTPLERGAPLSGRYEH